MKTNYLLIVFFILLTISSCSDDIINRDVERNIEFNKNRNVHSRLVFSSQEELKNSISSGSFLKKLKAGGEDTDYAPTVESDEEFISMLDEIAAKDYYISEELTALIETIAPTGMLEKDMTYYKALGYDTLVPNPNFACLLNPFGELEVGTEVIRITPMGTYKFPIGSEEELDKILEKTPEYLGEQIGENIYKINDNITLYRTFEEKPEDYSLIAEGNYEELPDSYFGDDDDTNLKSMITKSTSEPDFDSFQTFSADRKTWAGKLIQGIIGSNKASTVNFSSKRRVRGSFYFYNYFVYSEIGVKGWTDKKNWIGWSKTEADELRVGWTNVVLKSNIPDYYTQSLKDLNNIVYYPPQFMWINGYLVNVATLAMPDYKNDLKDKVIAQGTKAVYNYLKNELKRPATEWEKAQAFIIASRTDLYYVSGKQDVVKYNCEYYCHVFSNHWMQVTVGWSNQKGIFINNINGNNIDKTSTWLTAIEKAMNEKKTSLVSGEVYSCARFGNVWRGMKIVKKP